MSLQSTQIELAGVELTFRDALRVLCKQRAGQIIWLGLLIFLIVLPVVSVVSRFVKPEQMNGFRMSAVLFLFVTPALVMILFMVDLVLTARAAANSADIVDIVITERGIETSDKFGVSTRSWDGYSSVKELKSDFMLFTGATSVTPIPKRYFRGENEIAAFREIVRHYDLK